MWVAAKNTDFALSLLAAYVVYPPQFSMTRNPNLRWIVNCRNCLASFTHSEIGKDRKLNDYLFPTAPEFSSAGEEMECPSCKTKAIYTREDLQYRLRISNRSRPPDYELHQRMQTAVASPDSTVCSRTKPNRCVNARIAVFSTRICAARSSNFSWRAISTSRDSNSVPRPRC